MRLDFVLLFLGNFLLGGFNRLVDMIVSEVQMSLLHIDNKEDLMAFQMGLHTL